eukprot:Ihof_evm2s136 gene=Ihof_evmTU2s136
MVPAASGGWLTPTRELQPRDRLNEDSASDRRKRARYRYQYSVERTPERPASVHTPPPNTFARLRGAVGELGTVGANTVLQLLSWLTPQKPLPTEERGMIRTDSTFLQGGEDKHVEHGTMRGGCHDYTDFHNEVTRKYSSNKNGCHGDGTVSQRKSREEQMRTEWREPVREKEYKSGSSSEGEGGWSNSREDCGNHGNESRSHRATIINKNIQVWAKVNRPPEPWSLAQRLEQDEKNNARCQALCDKLTKEKQYNKAWRIAPSSPPRRAPLTLSSPVHKIRPSARSVQSKYEIKPMTNDREDKRTRIHNAEVRRLLGLDQDQPGSVDEGTIHGLENIELALRPKEIEVDPEMVRAKEELLQMDRLMVLVRESAQARKRQLQLQQKKRLTEEQRAKVHSLWGSGDPNEIIIQEFNQQITRGHLKLLQGQNWLNDEVINFYMAMINERSKTDPSLPQVHCFTTFFLPSLEDSYKKVMRWTRRIDIFEKTQLIVPVHLGAHWCLAIVHMKDKSVDYLDSLGGTNERATKLLLNYLSLESMDKKKIEFDTSNWIVRQRK